MTTVLTLPMPPSINHAFVNIPKRGRVKSKAYVQWRKDAGWAIQTQPHAKVGGPVSILIELRRPRTNADVDNRVKPVLDLLVVHNIIDDDKNVTQVTARWAEVDSCRVTVEAA